MLRVARFEHLVPPPHARIPIARQPVDLARPWPRLFGPFPYVAGPATVDGFPQLQLAAGESLEFDTDAFGQPIARYQAVSFELASLKAQIAAARALVYQAAALKDAGRRVTEEAAIAKLTASELAVHAADVAMQVHGGYGYMEESAIPRFYRDAKILTIGEGTSEILKLVIARQMGLNV